MDNDFINYIRSRNLEKVKNILENETNKNALYYKNIGLRVAILTNNIKMVKLIIKVNNLNISISNVIENIFFAINCGYLDIIIFLIEYFSIDKETVNDFGYTFLKASEYYYNELIKREYSQKELETSKKIIEYFSK